MDTTDIFDVLAKDENFQTMEWKIVPIRGDDECITHYLAIQRDVTPVGIGGPA